MAEIEVNNLGRYFGETKAVDGISFKVNKGDVLGFLGPNGAGKTTTMKVLTGFLSPTFGQVTILDKDIEKQSLEIRRCLGYLPENAPLYGEMDVRSFVSFIAEVRGIPLANRKSAVNQVIELTGLTGVTGKRIETLSKGYKRRVGLAQALVHDPEILILDEPTDGLDPNQKFEIRSLINKMAAQKVIILSTHILEEVDEVCTRAVGISDGKIVADDTPAKLRARSASYGAVAIRFEGEIPLNVGETLRNIADVREVREYSRKANSKVFYVYPHEQKDVLIAVYSEAQKHNWKYAGLGHEPGYLDEVFRELTCAITH